MMKTITIYETSNDIFCTYWDYHEDIESVRRQVTTTISESDMEFIRNTPSDRILEVQSKLREILELSFL